MSIHQWGNGWNYIYMLHKYTTIKADKWGLFSTTNNLKKRKNYFDIIQNNPIEVQMCSFIKVFKHPEKIFFKKCMRDLCVYLFLFFSVYTISVSLMGLLEFSFFFFCFPKLRHSNIAFKTEMHASSFSPWSLFNDSEIKHIFVTWF